jgi:hypothetical protein
MRIFLHSSRQSTFTRLKSFWSRTTTRGTTMGLASIATGQSNKSRNARSLSIRLSGPLGTSFSPTLSTENSSATFLPQSTSERCWLRTVSRMYSIKRTKPSCRKILSDIAWSSLNSCWSSSTWLLSLTPSSSHWKTSSTVGARSSRKLLNFTTRRLSLTGLTNWGRLKKGNMKKTRVMRHTSTICWAAFKTIWLRPKKSWPTC